MILRRLLAMTVLAAGLSAAAGAQCAMCFRTASAQQRARAKWLNAGIVVLGVPPFLILAGFVAFLFSRDKACGEAEKPRD